MVIDSRHRTWLVGTSLAAVAALGLYLGLSWDEPEAFTGGSRVGLLYGLAGGALIIFAALLSAST